MSFPTNSLFANLGLAANHPALLAQAMLQNPALAAGLAVASRPTPRIESDMIDPDCQELCDHFNIEERHARRLSDLMKKRHDTFVEDLERLYDVLERATSPAGLLVVKMREMEEGRFVGRVKADKELAAMCKKFKLDDQAETKLAHIMSRYDDEKRKTYMGELETHLATSNKPSAMVMMLLRKLGNGEPLGRVGPVAPGSYADKVRSGLIKDGKESSEKDKDKDRDRRGDGDRRSRSKDRGRDSKRQRERSGERQRERSRSRERRR